MSNRSYITVAQFNAIKLALAEGLRYRPIADKLGVSYSAVHRIAVGERVQTMDVGPPTSPEYLPAYRGVTLFQEFSPVEVCPECGVRVRMPCLACQIRGLQKRGRRHV